MVLVVLTIFDAGDFNFLFLSKLVVPGFFIHPDFGFDWIFFVCGISGVNNFLSGSRLIFLFELVVFIILFSIFQ